MARIGLPRDLGLVLASLAVVALVGARAEARPPARARLIYATEDPKGVCASEADFRGKVAARLGYDPFRDDASITWVFRVQLDGRSKRPRAEISTEKDGTPSGKRTLDDASCDALSETVASAIAIAIDPLATSSGVNEHDPVPSASASPPQPPPPPPPPPQPPVKEQPPQPTNPTAPTIPVVFLDGTVALGRTAGAALGGRAGVGLAYRALSVALEVRGEATPGPVQITPIDRVSWSAFSGGLAVCGQKSLLQACVIGAVGSLQAKAEDVSRPSLKGTLFGLVGPRVGVIVPLGGDFGLRANGELGIPLVRTTFNIDGNAAWTAPAVQGSFGVGLEVRFR